MEEEPGQSSEYGAQDVAGSRVVAERLIDRLKDFASGLPVEERALFAALIAPGIALAFNGQDDVHGFEMVDWQPSGLPDHLASAIRSKGMRVTFD